MLDILVYFPDINECSDPNKCGAHSCVNTDGDFWCKCNSGFTHTEESKQHCTGKIQRLILKFLPLFLQVDSLR